MMQFADMAERAALSLQGKQGQPSGTAEHSKVLSVDAQRRAVSHRLAGATSAAD